MQPWLKEEAANTEPPTLADVIQGILSRQKQTGKSDRYQSYRQSESRRKKAEFPAIKSDYGHSRA